MLISVLFMIPDSVLLCLFLISINANIKFARLEEFGNEYQRPLEELLESLPNHLLLLRQEDRGPARIDEIREQEKRIDQALLKLEAEDSRLGVSLQFTDEGLAKRKREHYRVQNLKAEWNKLRLELPGLSRAESAVRHEHLIADVRTMITHVGDTSNLILDPDLDSYYLMDVTLLALPQMQDRLSSVMMRGVSIIEKGSIARQDQSQLAVDAALLQESDLDRVIGSTRTALNEDSNFYGASESFQRRIPPVLEEFSNAARSFIELVAAAGRSEEAKPASAEFLKAGFKARELSFKLWKTSDEELGVLLKKRIHYYQSRRTRSLSLTGLALVAAVLFVAFITRSISRPLQKQAAQLRASNQALQAQIQERERAEAALRIAEEKYRKIFENSTEGIFQTSPEGEYLVSNPTLARMYGYESVKELQSEMHDISGRLYVQPSRRDEFKRLMEQQGTIHGFESEIYRKDRSVIWIAESARAVRDSAGKVTYYEGTVTDITERKQNEIELEKIHQKLVDASRRAGMAEVATGVLHNVGNVLNSVNVSANFVADSLRKSKLVSLPKVARLLLENSSHIGEFLTENPKGRQVPGYLNELASHLTNENQALVKKMEQLREHLDHIKEIVAMQQTYARVSGIVETINVTDLVEEALRLNSGALTRHQVEILRQYESHPVIQSDKHKVLQILVNLIANAKYACADTARPDRTIVLRVSASADSVKIMVADNGVGIPPENLIRIFNHGFSTRSNGHGFGLHSGALAAEQLNASLVAESDGPGKGATFTLELPMSPKPAYA